MSSKNAQDRSRIVDALLLEQEHGNDAKYLNELLRVA